VAASFVSAEASDALAFFNAVRSADRCARLRTVAARDLRIFFFADAIFGTKKRSPMTVKSVGFAKVERTRGDGESQGAITL
jgi:hypothetical protein